MCIKEAELCSNEWLSARRCLEKAVKYVGESPGAPGACVVRLIVNCFPVSSK